MESAHAAELAKLERLVESLDEALQAIAAVNDVGVERRLKAFIKAIEGKPESVKIAMAEKLEADLETFHQRLYGPRSRFSETYRATMAQASAAGKRRLAAATEEAIGRKVAAALSRTDTAAAIRSGRDAYSLAAKNFATDAVAEIRQAVTTEILKGSGEEELTRRLMKSGHITDLELPRRKLRASQRAEMIARTEPRRISEASYRAGAAEVEPEPAKRLYQWVSVMGATSGDDSLRRHGLIMTEQEWQKHDFGDGYFGFPPLRPNDRCSVIFMREQWLEESAKAALESPAGTDARRIVQTGEEAERTRLLGV